MANLFERVVVVLDRLLPERLRSADPDTKRRARLALVFPLVMLLPGPAFFVMFLAQGHTKLAFQVVGFDVIVALVIVVLRVTGSIRAAAIYYSLVFTSMLFLLMRGSGSVFTPGLLWLGITPLISQLTAGKGAGRVALAVSFLAISGLGVLSAMGLDHPPADPLMVQVVGNVFGTFLLIGAIYGLGSVFDKAQRRAHAEVIAREHEVRRLLDHSGQGFVTIKRDGAMIGARSAALERWFGAPAEACENWSTYVGRTDKKAGDVFKLSFDALGDAFLPDEVVLDQMPKRVRVGTGSAVVLGVALQPIGDGGAEAFLVVVTDLTAEVARERNEAAQREMVAVTEHAIRDLRGLRLLVDDADRAIEQIANRSPDTFRLVHTLKGNMALFGVSTVASLCHELESALVEGRVRGVHALTSEQSDELAATYRAFRERADVLLRGNPSVVQVQRKAIAALRARIEHQASAPELLSSIDAWELEPVEQSFMRLGASARALAQRVGKGDLDVELHADDLGLPLDRFAPFWAAAVHLIRNAVDHGIETPDERRAARKTARPKLVMSARIEGSATVLEVSDDGRGIDWSRLAERAAASGLPSATRQDLVDSLFVDGITTRDDVSDLSGRGVGLAAVADTVSRLDGTVDVHSDGDGTMFVFRFPRERRALERTRRAG